MLAAVFPWWSCGDSEREGERALAMGPVGRRRRSIGSARQSLGRIGPVTADVVAAHQVRGQSACAAGVGTSTRPWCGQMTGRIVMLKGESEGRRSRTRRCIAGFDGRESGQTRIACARQHLLDPAPTPGPAISRPSIELLQLPTLLSMFPPPNFFSCPLFYQPLLHRISSSIAYFSVDV